MSAKAKKKAPTTAESTWQTVHAAYLASPGDDDGNPPNLGRLAKRFGLRLASLKDRALTFKWQLEWRAEGARAWYRDHGHGARNEAEFCARFAEHAKNDRSSTYPRLMAEIGPEARALVHATARELWWRIMPPVFRWDAEQQVELARGAIDAIQNERNRLRLAGAYIDEDVGPELRDV